MPAPEQRRYERGETIRFQKAYDQRPREGRVWEYRGESIIVLVGHRAARGGTHIETRVPVKQAEVVG